MPLALSPLAAEMAWVSAGDDALDSTFPGVNVVLNRARLAAFLSEFGEDRDVRDFLALDVLATMAGLPLSSTGVTEAVPMPSLVLRPFRLWEYTWLYKVLGLASGGIRVLELGGPATHLSLLTAIAGCHITTLDLNEKCAEDSHVCANALNLGSFQPVVGDMRDLSRFPDSHFDAVMSCSVLEHLTAKDQEIALQEIARVLKPDGMAGLTFDYGPGAPGASEYLPPPHEPPSSAAETVRRYSQTGLHVVGNDFAEDPTPGCLFHSEIVRYTVAALFLAKTSSPEMRTPRSQTAGSVLHGFVLTELPLRLYAGLTRVRNQLLRVPMLEEGLEATEAARAKLSDDFGRLTADFHKLETDGLLNYTARRYARWKQDHSNPKKG